MLHDFMTYPPELPLLLVIPSVGIDGRGGGDRVEKVFLWWW
jgi:hypothetical protein